LYERARAALRSEMHGAYPPFRRSEIAAAEMSLEMAIEAVEASAVRGQNAKLATPVSSSARANVPGTPGPLESRKVRRSLATLGAGFLRRPDEAASGREAMPDRGTDSRGRTWLTELLARASRGVDSEGQNLTPRWVLTQNGEANRQHP